MEVLVDFLNTPLLGKDAWLWLVFAAIVVSLLAFDLGVLHKDDKEILLAFIKIRNGKTPCAFTIYAKPGITFAQKMIVKQVDRKNSADDEDEEDVDIAA